MTAPGRRAAILAIPVLALLLGSCSSGTSSSLTSAAATARYEPILREVAAATSADMDLAWVTGTALVTQRSDDGCTWHSTTMTADVDLGTAHQWDTLRTATKAALEKHGFSDAAEVEIPGGFTGVEATDTQGATLRVESKGRSSLRITVPVSDGC